MCHRTDYKLVCEHVVSTLEYCHRGSRSSQRPCRNLTRTSFSCITNEITHTSGHRSSSSSSSRIAPPPPCPLGSDCHYSMKGGIWNCCWCGCGPNSLGRCRAVLMVDRQKYRCEHICCENCEGVADGCY